MWQCCCLIFYKMLKMVKKLMVKMMAKTMVKTMGKTTTEIDLMIARIEVVSWCCTDAPNMTSNIIEILKY